MSDLAFGLYIAGAACLMTTIAVVIVVVRIIVKVFNHVMKNMEDK